MDLILKISPELENAYKLKKKYAHLNRYTRYDEADKKLWTFIDEIKVRLAQKSKKCVKLLYTGLKRSRTLSSSLTESDYPTESWNQETA